MRGLSVRGPWAPLLVVRKEVMIGGERIEAVDAEGRPVAYKWIETRGWKGFPESQIGERVAIHMGQTVEDGAPAEVFELAEAIYPGWRRFLGCVIGAARVVGVVRFTEQTWRDLQAAHLCPAEYFEEGKMGIRFVWPQKLRYPVRRRGELGLFRIRGEEALSLEGALGVLPWER